MAARTPSIHFFPGRPLFLLSPGIHSIINFVSLSSCILLTWPYHWSLFLSMMSIISGFSFTPIISFILVCSFFILSILDFLADLLSTSISVDKILFISLVGILLLLLKTLCISWCKNFHFISAVCQSPQMAQCPLSDSWTCSNLAHVLWFLLWRTTAYSLLEGTATSPTLFYSSTSERRKHQNYVSAKEYLKTVNKNYFNFLIDDCNVTWWLRTESLHSAATRGLFTFWRRLQYCGPGWLVNWKYVEGRKRVWKFEILSCGSLQAWMISELEICGRKEGRGCENLKYYPAGPYRPGWLVDWKYVEGRQRVWKFEILSCGSLQAWMINVLEICGRKEAGVKIWNIILRVLTGLDD